MTPDRLRIALVVHDYNRHGGHAGYTAELATRFKRDHEVHVYANTFDEPDPTGLTYHHVPAWRRNALTTVLSFILPGTVAVRGRFDVVHAQGLCGLRHDVATAHIIQPAWYAGIEQMNGRLNTKQRLWRTVVGRLESLALTGRGVRRAIAVSGRVRDDLATYYGRTAGVEVIPHGVDTDRFHPRNRAAFRDAVRAELGITDGEFIALYVGDLKKGAGAAIRAAATAGVDRLVFVSASNTTPFRVGTDPGRVLFRPPTRQIERYYAAADVLLFPTVYDSFGLVITEAMATGLPVVTTRTAGASDVVCHGESGWLADDPADQAALVAGLRYLATPGRRTAAGVAARAAVELYTWDRVASRTMAVYRAVVTEKRGTGWPT